MQSISTTFDIKMSLIGKAQRVTAPFFLYEAGHGVWMRKLIAAWLYTS